MINKYIIYNLYNNNILFFFQLLKRNETVMLFPGGAKEALHGKGDEYKLFWYGKMINYD